MAAPDLSCGMWECSSLTRVWTYFKEKLGNMYEILLHIFQIYKLNYSNKTVFSTAAAAAKSLQSCLTLCDPIYGSPPGPAFHIK